MWSVSTRLCSSGIAGRGCAGPPRGARPGCSSFTAASAAASVELTSPGRRRGGLPLQQHLLDADERAGGLLGVRTGADAEEDVGRGQAELLEEHSGHVGVVVLPGVHEHELERRGRAPAARGGRAPPS